MNDFLNYLANNVPLFSICALMIFLSFRNLRLRKVQSIYFLVFTTIVLILSAVVMLEKYAQREGLPILGTIFTSLGYILRPILLFIFILLANMDHRRSRNFFLFLGIPLLVNIIIYVFPLFFNVPGLSTFVFSYQLNDDGTASFIRGGIFNFFSHFISVFYLLALIYVSTMRFHGKHYRDGLVIVLCVFIIIITVLTEMLFDRNDLLNIVGEICALINYIFIMTINSSRDALTNLYDRRTYYEDITKYKELVNGIIQIDMNELKYLNDTFGHKAGDDALSEISLIIDKSLIHSSLCAYRLSGDEFLILMFQDKKEILEETVNKIKELVSTSKYSIALGYIYYTKEDKLTFEDAMKKAEELMYLDKNIHYQQSGHERRKI